MKIALISTVQCRTPPIGYGSEARTWDLAQALVLKGHKVTLFAPNGSGGRGVDLRTIPLVTSGQPIDYRAAEAVPFWKYRDDLLAHDVVHDMSLTLRTHELLCLHGYHKSLGTLNGICYESPEAEEARRNIVVVSECARKHAMSGETAWVETPWEEQSKASGAPRMLTTCRVVRYGVDIEFYSPRGHHSEYVLYVGRPHSAKGMDVLVEVASYLSSTQFVVAWHAELENHKHYEREVLGAIKSRGVKNIEFVDLGADEDHQARKRDLMSMASVFFHPAIYIDACPSGPIEAQACGTPVVAFRRGGTFEIVDNGHSGILVPYFRWWERPELIGPVFGDAIEQARNLDRAGVRQYAEIQLSAERMADDYLSLYAATANSETW